MNHQNGQHFSFSGCGPAGCAAEEQPSADCTSKLTNLTQKKRDPFQTLCFAGAVAFGVLALSCSHVDAVAVCGNGTLEDGEACDDGNTDDGDGCSRRCELERGGDDCFDSDHDGYFTSEECGAELDCDDSDELRHPGAVELCNGIDDDCDGSVDEEAVATFYRDTDEDGYGHFDQSVEACPAPPGYVEHSSDCDDADPDRNPGETEVCDGLDNDCDTETDEGVTFTFCPDFDEDRFGDPSGLVETCSAPVGYVSNCDDCNDEDSTIKPTADEVCDEIDNDCNDLIDDDALISFWLDFDGDGFGDSEHVVEACAPPEDYVDNDQDCDDSLDPTYPDADEICNGEDDDCDSEIDNEVVDCLDYEMCYEGECVELGDGDACDLCEHDYDCVGAVCGEWVESGVTWCSTECDRDTDCPDRYECDGGMCAPEILGRVCAEDRPWIADSCGNAVTSLAACGERRHCSAGECKCDFESFVCGEGGQRRYLYARDVCGTSTERLDCGEGRYCYIGPDYTHPRYAEAAYCCDSGGNCAHSLIRW